MNTNRGIFENYPNPSTARQESPFSIAQDPAATPTAASPFAPVARQESPFMIVDDTKPAETEKPVKLPERRKIDSPFQVAEPSEGFGFEAPAPAFDTPPPVKSPFAPATPASPFAAQGAPAASASTQAAIAAFTNWQEPAPPAPAPQSYPQTAASPFAPASPQVFAPAAQQEPSPQAPPSPVQIPAAFAPAATPVAAPSSPAKETSPTYDDSYSDSFSIRQIELRAIFGVDREMNAEEIIQRSRALPGMRNIARVNPQDMSTIEALKNLIPSLGFGSGLLKLYSGSVPLEFIREGSVMLAVQTDGGFAPGVRETLMIVARELNRLG